MSNLICCSKKLIFVRSVPKTNLLFFDGEDSPKIMESTKEISAIAASDNLLVIGYKDKSITISNIPEGGFLILPSAEFVAERVAEQLMVCEYEGKEAILMNDGSDIVMYEIGNIGKPKILMGHIATVTRFALNSDMTRLATCDRDGRVRISKYPNTYDIIKFCLYHEEFVTSLLFLPSSGELISGDADGQLVKWDPEGNFLLAKNVFPKESIINGIAALGENIVVICENSKQICIVSAETLETVKTLQAPLVTLCADSFNSQVYVGCNGAMVVINEALELSTLKGFKEKLPEPLPTKETLRVTKKNIIHKGENSGETYTLWRSPETAPSRDE